MLRYIYILASAALLLAACTKTDVTYDAPSEIAFTPVAEGMTKAAVGAGNTLPTDQDLSIWANYAEVGNSDAKVGDPYLDGVQYEYADGYWLNADCFWPKSGTLTFAGCTTPTTGDPNYDNDSNTITVYGFEQSNLTKESIDLMWFNRTTPVNHNGTEASLAIEMKHALAWITIKAYGASGSKDWLITNITMDNVVLGGDVECTTANGAEWDIVETDSATEDETDNDIVIYNSTTGKKIGQDPDATVENTENGTLLIPQIPKTIYVSYKTSSEGAVTTKPLNLKISDDDNLWKAGVHYTYTIFFNPYKIDFTVSQDDGVGGWTSGGTITVQ